VVSRICQGLWLLVKAADVNLPLRRHVTFACFCSHGCWVGFHTLFIHQYFSSRVGLLSVYNHNVVYPTGKIHWKNTLEQLKLVGPQSLGVALLTAGFVGMVFTIQVRCTCSHCSPPCSCRGSHQEGVVLELTSLYATGHLLCIAFWSLT